MTESHTRQSRRRQPNCRFVVLCRLKDDVAVVHLASNLKRALTVCDELRHRYPGSGASFQVAPLQGPNPPHWLAMEKRIQAKMAAKAAESVAPPSPKPRQFAVERRRLGPRVLDYASDPR